MRYDKWVATAIMAIMAVFPVAVRRLPGVRRLHRWAVRIRTEEISATSGDGDHDEDTESIEIPPRNRGP